MKLLNWIDINKLNWVELSRNENAVELLKENQDKINWLLFSTNPSIFTLDYKQMTINFQLFAEEIIAKAMDPDRIKRLSIIYKFEFKDWFDY